MELLLMNKVTDNITQSRFDLTEGGKLAFANYCQVDGILHITHVEAHPDLRGTGAAGRLMEGLLELVREHGLKVRPICSYAASYMQRHPETTDLLA